jgi:hypothetical protein
VPSPRRLSDAVAGSIESEIDLDSDLRTLVTFSRSHPKDVGQRQVFVRLDDGPSVTLRFGESITEVVEPGSHRVRAHNTFMRKTVTFTVESGEHLEFMFINRCGPIWQGLAAIFGSAPMFLTVRRRSLV